MENEATMGAEDQFKTESESVGMQLRLARELKKLSIAEISKVLKMKSCTIDALEADNYECLGKLVYVRGYIRAYARYLKMDSDQLLAQMPIVNGNEGIDTAKQNPNLHIDLQHHPRLRRFKPSLIGYAVVVLILAGVIMWWHNLPTKLSPTQQQDTIPLSNSSTNMGGDEIAIKKLSAADTAALNQRRK